MRTLGIDPGIARTGWGVIEEIDGKIKAIGYDCFETEATEEVSKRLKLIHEKILKVIDEYKPDHVAIEQIFFSRNTKTALAVGQARGVILLASARKSLPNFTYTPLQVKITITGYGRAEKKLVGDVIKTTLCLESVPKPDDTADALAIALTHSFFLKNGIKKKIDVKKIAKKENPKKKVKKSSKLTKKKVIKKE